MSPSERPPQDNYVTVSTDLLMNASDKKDLHNGMVEMAREAMLGRITNSFSAHLEDIPLRGRMPLEVSELGGKYKRLHFEATKDQSHDPEDASVGLWLVGSRNRRNEQLEFKSEERAVEFGRNKEFLITPFREKVSTGTINCADFWYDLDLMIPDTGRFSALIDPRTDHAFDYIALATADLLRPLSKSHESTRTYLSKDYSISQVDKISYIGEIGSRLAIEQKGKKTTLTLSSTAPVDLYKKRVIEHLKCELELKKGKLVSGQVSLSMLSKDMSAKDLYQCIRKTQKDINALQIGEKALALLRQDLPTVR